MTFSDFMLEYERIHSSTSTYRLGQHFINRFIHSSSTPAMVALWEEYDNFIVMKSIKEIMVAYHWDCGNLPTLHYKGE